MTYNSDLSNPSAHNSPQLASEEKALLNFSLDVICSINAEGRFTYVTRAAKHVWGYDPSELVGQRYLDLVIPEDRPKTTRMAEQIMQGSDITSFENRYQRKDGTTVPILWSAHWDKGTQTLYCVAKDATALHAAEKKTQNYEQRLFKAYKLGQIGWWEWNALTDENTVSDELYQIYGLTKTDCPQLSTEVYLSLVHPEDLPIVKEAMAMNRQQQYNQYEHRMIKPSGETVYVIHHAETIWNEKGELLQIHGITKDITSRKTAELKVKASEQKLTTILESIGDGFFAVDRSWTVTYWNRKAEEILLKKREDIVGKNLWEEYAPALSLRFYSEYHHAIQENTAVYFEEYFPPLEMWIEASAYPSAEGLSVYFKDITEKKRVEEALQESNRRYEMVSRATSDAIWDWNLETEKIYWGEGSQTIFGHSDQTLTSDLASWEVLVHPDDLERVLKTLWEAINGTAEKWQDEYRFRKADGTYAFVNESGFLIRGETGKAIRMVGAIKDVTHQKTAELSQKLSEEQFRLLFFESPRPKWMFRGDTFQIVEANDAALKLYGYTKEEFLRLTIPDLKLPEEVQELYALRKAGANQYHNIVKHRKKNGELFSIEISTHSLHLPTGLHFIVDGNDVTERQKLQQMVMDEKIAAQKEVARAIIATEERERSEIAKELHDNVNQLLTTAKLYVENISYFPAQQESFVKKGVELLQRSINEIRVLSKQLVTPALHEIGFKSAVDELLNHYLSLNLFDIRLCYNLNEHDLDKELQLTIYRIVQEQLNNIVKHAKATRVVIEAGYDGAMLKISICDNGVGFEKEKAGKGLGLANMKNRAEVYKGTVDIQSAIGKGTTITVRFPHRLIKRA